MYLTISLFSKIVPDTGDRTGASGISLQIPQVNAMINSGQVCGQQSCRLKNVRSRKILNNKKPGVEMVTNAPTLVISMSSFDRLDIRLLTFCFMSIVDGLLIFSDFNWSMRFHSETFHKINHKQV